MLWEKPANTAHVPSTLSFHAPRYSPLEASMCGLWVQLTNQFVGTTLTLAFCFRSAFICRGCRMSYSSTPTAPLVFFLCALPRGGYCNLLRDCFLVSSAALVRGDPTYFVWGWNGIICRVYSSTCVLFRSLGASCALVILGGFTRPIPYQAPKFLREQSYLPVQFHLFLSAHSR